MSHCRLRFCHVLSLNTRFEITFLVKYFTIVFWADYPSTAWDTYSSCERCLNPNVSIGWDGGSLIEIDFTKVLGQKKHAPAMRVSALHQLQLAARPWHCLWQLPIGTYLSRTVCFSFATMTVPQRFDPVFIFHTF